MIFQRVHLVEEDKNIKIYCPDCFSHRFNVAGIGPYRFDFWHWYQNEATELNLTSEESKKFVSCAALPNSPDGTGFERIMEFQSLTSEIDMRLMETEFDDI
jgi:hypothetical protein